MQRFVTFNSARSVICFLVSFLVKVMTVCSYPYISGDLTMFVHIPISISISSLLCEHMIHRFVSALEDVSHHVKH